jgi:hypothetical protein
MPAVELATFAQGPKLLPGAFNFWRYFPANGFFTAFFPFCPAFVGGYPDLLRSGPPESGGGDQQDDENDNQDSIPPANQIGGHLTNYVAYFLATQLDVVVRLPDGLIFFFTVHNHSYKPSSS